jgi:hypothetical protein
MLFVHAGIGDIELCLRDPARIASNIARAPGLRMQSDSGTAEE